MTGSREREREREYRGMRREWIQNRGMKWEWWAGEGQKKEGKYRTNTGWEKSNSACDLYQLCKIPQMPFVHFFNSWCTNLSSVIIYSSSNLVSKYVYYWNLFLFLQFFVLLLLIFLLEITAGILAYVYYQEVKMRNKCYIYFISIWVKSLLSF